MISKFRASFIVDLKEVGVLKGRKYKYGPKMKKKEMVDRVEGMKKLNNNKLI